jgi:pimeloyl-ACP methyl ester carboxylesterase
MLDLLISYLNFFILTIKYIVKLISFQPPNPKGYRIKNSNNEVQENYINLDLNPGDIIEILFYIPNKPKNENEANNNVNTPEKKNDKIDKNDKNSNTFIYQNKRLEYRPANNRISNYELVYFENEDNNTKTPAFLFKPKEYLSAFVLKYLIIYCHGNSGDIGTSFTECQILSRNVCCNVLCFEYPGYGLSTDVDNINEKRAYFNIRQAYKYARNKLKYKPENIIIYGFSLGTGIAFDLACDEHYPTGGVILQSAFLSIIRTIYNFKKTYYFDLFNSCDKAKKCKTKIFFIHGDKDTIVPYVHGRILSTLIPKKYFSGFYTVPGANHNDIIKFAKETLYLEISNFLSSLDREQPPEKEISSDSNISYDKLNYQKYKENKNRNKIENEQKIYYNENNNISSHDELKALENK